jgi:hypothetical protein
MSDRSAHIAVITDRSCPVLGIRIDSQSVAEVEA